MAEAVILTQPPDVENIGLYRFGGFHPIHIGDLIRSRYRIINKLGYGSYSTVWLAEDSLRKRFVSLKVLIAGASAQNRSSEIAVLQHLMAKQKVSAGPTSVPGKKYVVKVFETFEIQGPNGRHCCVVTELLGPHIATYTDRVFHLGILPVEITKAIAAQVARGVAYLHQCGIVHGDLNLMNVLLYHSAMGDWSASEIEHYFDSPIIGPVYLANFNPLPESQYTPNLPKHLVYDNSTDRTRLLELCLTSPETVHIKICDFSESFLVDPHPDFNPPVLHCPRIHAAPEVIFKEPTGPPTDIWALAILLHEILGGCTLFPSYRDIETEVVQEIFLTLGRPPDRWWNKWADRTKCFDENGVPLPDAASHPMERPSAGHLVWKVVVDTIGETDATILDGLMMKMVRYEMKDRISADEVVKLIPDTWMGVDKA